MAARTRVEAGERAPAVASSLLMSNGAWRRFSAVPLYPVINATGVIFHTNLGRLR